MDAEKLKAAFTSRFGGNFVYSEPGYDLLYCTTDDDEAYITPKFGLDLLIKESLECSRNLIIERCPTFEYDPDLIY